MASDSQTGQQDIRESSDQENIKHSIFRTSTPSVRQLTLADLPRPHDRLWFSDGDVVVATPEVCFRVDGVILRKYSPVFELLIDDAWRCTRSLEIFEGCRVLRLVDDGKAMEQLVYALYQHHVEGSMWKGNIPIGFHEMCRVVDLALKYKAYAVIQEAVLHAERAFPTFWTDSGMLEHHGFMSDYDAPVSCQTSTDCIKAVVLARAISQARPPSFIVTALYHCAHMNPAMLYEPSEPDGGRWLSYDDFHRVLSARDELAELCSTVRRPLLDAAETPRCENARCHASLRRLAFKWTRDGMFTRHTALSSCAPAFEEHAEEYPDERICEACQNGILADIDMRRRELFLHLGKLFSICTWPHKPAEGALFEVADGFFLDYVFAQ